MRALFSLLVATVPMLASASGFDVTVRGGNKLAAISFQTKEQFAQPCWLEAKSISMALPETAEGTGLVEFTTRVDASKPCLESEGPQRGVLALPNEADVRLPGLPYGRYQLKIDGEKVGTLTATRHAVELVNE